MKEKVQRYSQSINNSLDTIAIETELKIKQGKCREIQDWILEKE